MKKMFIFGITMLMLFISCSTKNEEVNEEGSILTTITIDNQNVSWLQEVFGTRAIEIVNSGSNKQYYCLYVSCQKEGESSVLPYAYAMTSSSSPSFSIKLLKGYKYIFEASFSDCIESSISSVTYTGSGKYYEDFINRACYYGKTELLPPSSRIDIHLKRTSSPVVIKTDYFKSGKIDVIISDKGTNNNQIHYSYQLSYPNTSASWLLPLCAKESYEDDDYTEVKSVTICYDGTQPLANIEVPFKKTSKTIFSINLHDIDYSYSSIGFNVEDEEINEENNIQIGTEIEGLCNLIAGKSFNSLLKTIANSGTYDSPLSYDMKDYKINSIKFVAGSSKTTDIIVSASSSPTPAYLDYFENQGLYDFEIYTRSQSFELNTNSSYMFAFMENMQELIIEDVKSSWCKQFNDMFNECKSLKEVDLNQFETSKATSMARMFKYCTNLYCLDLSLFDTRNVISMKKMFSNCEKLKWLQLGSNFVIPLDNEDMFHKTARNVSSCIIFTDYNDQTKNYIQNLSSKFIVFLAGSLADMQNEEALELLNKYFHQSLYDTERTTYYLHGIRKVGDSDYVIIVDVDIYDGGWIGDSPYIYFISVNKYGYPIKFDKDSY